MSEVNAQILDNTTELPPVIPPGWKLTHVYLRDGSALDTDWPYPWRWYFSDDSDSSPDYDILSYRIEKKECSAGREERDSATADSVAGRKDDAGKPRIWEVMDGFKRALWAVARVGTWGGEVKYSDRPFDNWANVPDGYRRYSNSRERHYLASDGDINEESGMPHEWHAVWCALAALELKLREKDGE